MSYNCSHQRPVVENWLWKPEPVLQNSLVDWLCSFRTVSGIALTQRCVLLVVFIITYSSMLNAEWQVCHLDMSLSYSIYSAQFPSYTLLHGIPLAQTFFRYSFPIVRFFLMQKGPDISPSSPTTPMAESSVFLISYCRTTRQTVTARVLAHAVNRHL